MPAFPQHPFWDFAVAVYGRPGVAPACLDLQERHGVDVNMLLFCLWSAAAGRAPLRAGELEAVLRRATEWQADVVRPLRAARRRMKHGIEGVTLDLVLDVRRRLADVEIECERLEQLAIAAAAGPGEPAPGETTRLDVAWDNLERLFAAIDTTLSEEDRQALRRVVVAALPGFET